MNDTLTLCLEILFWFALFVVFYTYLGYGILLYILQAERVFRETSETLAAGNGRGTAGGDAVYHGFQRRGGGGREDGELP